MIDGQYKSMISKTKVGTGVLAPSRLHALLQALFPTAFDISSAASGTSVSLPRYPLGQLIRRPA